MTEETADIEALTQALIAFTKTTQTMEEAYRRLEMRLDELDQELAGKNRELALTSDYLTNLLESMSDGVVAIDTNGVITRFNRAASAILGYEAEEVVGQRFRETFDREFPAPRIYGAMELRSRSGRLVPVSERDSAIADRTGRVLGSVKIFQDLSELIALREQVRQIDRLAAIGEMAATVAHEIRNPLGGIRGFAAFLAQDIPPEDPRRRLVDKINEGARNLDKVVGELLEYTRPVELSLRPTPVASIIEAALSYLDYDRDRISVISEADPELNVRADPDKMRQVFLNILLNAVQSIRERGDVRIMTVADTNSVTVVFRDTGCGMTEQQCKQICSPFFTTKEKGTGLGMAVSAKIVDGHGGELWAESGIGQGTTINVRLARTE